MIKTYVVNMVKDVAKREAILSQVNDSKVSEGQLDVELFPATEGRKMTPEEIDKIADWKEFQRLYRDCATLPALGCSISHWRIYKAMADDASSTYALILEDDAWLTPNLATNVKEIAERCFADGKPAAVMLTPEWWYREENLLSDYSAGKIYKITNALMTSGYLINKAGAVLLAEKLLPIRYIADCWSTFVGFGLTLYGVVPHIISYPNELGEIGRSQDENLKRDLVRKLRYPLARLKGKLSMLRDRMRGNKESKKLW